MAPNITAAGVAAAKVAIVQRATNIGEGFVAVEATRSSDAGSVRARYRAPSIYSRGAEYRIGFLRKHRAINSGSYDRCGTGVAQWQRQTHLRDQYRAFDHDKDTEAAEEEEEEGDEGEYGRIS